MWRASFPWLRNDVYCQDGNCEAVGLCLVVDTRRIAEPASKVTSSFQPLSPRPGTTVIIRPLSFAPVSSLALVVILVSRLHVRSPDGQDLGNLMTAAPSYKGK